MIPRDAPRHAPPGGTLRLAGRTVSRLGLGTMGLTGPGNWGPPPDPAQAVRLLRTAVGEHGVTHLDTADAYGPHTVEELIRRALHPYGEELLVATKVGLVRPGPGTYEALGRPAYLRHAVEASLRRLGCERLSLCYLHRVDESVPLADQLGTLTDLRDEGKIAGIGLSRVTAEEIDRARGLAPIAAVQNPMNPARRPDPALDHCRGLGIPYVAYRPLGKGRLVGEGLPSVLGRLLNLGPHVALVPGTTSVDHLRQLVEAARAADGHVPQLP
ncbi:aldo/keto reductase [Streptomyces gilvifuscus]|uniref:Aldo/keto reductase n=1 Tax=Streptomyces gilvifuscus TaxID=1550617 RepID=A0ABT5G971_9ACTN|nr:aldo/keto reductase [Streptomyces gilvifuscus]MDC2961121.1 aldo/keto reductase [Streptomyces gilvifuscus]